MAKTYSYTITEEEYNNLPDESKQAFVENPEAEPEWLKEWKKEKLQDIRQSKREERSLK